MPCTDKAKRPQAEPRRRFLNPTQPDQRQESSPMPDLTADQVRQAKVAVLAEYRRSRHAHRPHEAMHHLGINYATAYAVNALCGVVPSAQRQQDTLARFQVADLYATHIWMRAYSVTAGRPFWRNGTLAKPAPVSS